MKFLKVLISMILVATMCVTMMMPASAGRVTYYLSDLKMADDVSVTRPESRS